MENTSEDKFCSFCATPYSPLSRVAGGFGAFICEHCVRRFADIHADPQKTKDSQVPPWESMTHVELLRVLPEIVTAGDQIDGFLHDWVDMLRERGISWHQIGLALGVTRQAAWQRFTRARPAVAKRG